MENYFYIFQLVQNSYLASDYLLNYYFFIEIED